MQALRTLLDRVVMTVCVILFIEMTIVGTYQIVTRYFFNSPSTISEEIVTYSFTWLSILAAAYVFGK
ncbi:MAG: TRAP transporter small permease subunit, partial [Succinatimonas hippei]|nr:TRAP transporter small permease subunit [Succinatimonas hippei]